MFKRVMLRMNHGRGYLIGYIIHALFLQNVPILMSVRGRVTSHTDTGIDQNDQHANPAVVTDSDLSQYEMRRRQIPFMRRIGRDGAVW
jgi:hypothetical protein